MGNRKPPKKDDGHVIEMDRGMVGTHILVQGDDGFIAVVSAEKMQAEGYLVPKAYSALYWLFYQYAPLVQEEIGCRNPTKKEVEEISKRLVKKFGSQFKGYVREAIEGVMENDEWIPETPWDFAQELIPLDERKPKPSPITLLPEYASYPEKGDDEKDDEEDSQDPGGDDDVS